jgi:flagellar biosynthesis protein FlhG
VFRKLSQVADKFLKGICLDYAGCVLRDDYLKQAVVKRQPLVCAYPRAEASRNMDVLADRLLRGLASSDPPDGNIKFFWKRLVEETV